MNNANDTELCILYRILRLGKTNWEQDLEEWTSFPVRASETCNINATGFPYLPPKGLHSLLSLVEAWLLVAPSR